MSTPTLNNPATRVLMLSLLLTAATFASACGGSSDPGQGSAEQTKSTIGDSSDEEESAATDAKQQEVSERENDADQSVSSQAGESEGQESGASTGDTTSDMDYEDAESPLAALLGFDSFEDPSYRAEQQRKVEASIQNCMREQGFEYQVSPAAADLRFGRAIAPGLSDAEFAATHGYGITHSFDAMLSVSSSDPNSELTDSMSQGELAAWTTALLGQTDSEDGFDPFAGGGGCLSEAVSEVFSNFEVIMRMSSKFEELDQQIHADPRMAELIAIWSSCMAEKGYVYQDDSEPASQLYQELQQALGTDMFGGSDPMAFDSSLSPEQQQMLDDFAEKETEIAAADHSCRVDQADEATEIARRYELEFIETNRQELEGLSE